MAVPQLRLLLIREDIEGLIDTYLIPDQVVEAIADNGHDAECDWAISQIKNMIWQAGPTSPRRRRNPLTLMKRHVPLHQTLQCLNCHWSPRLSAWRTRIVINGFLYCPKCGSGDLDG